MKANTKIEKKIGRGKAYYDGKLIFEGEFLDGKRIGKGKMYDVINCKLLFEGVYLDDKE